MPFRPLEHSLSTRSANALRLRNPQQLAWPPHRKRTLTQNLKNDKKPTPAAAAFSVYSTLIGKVGDALKTAAGDAAVLGGKLKTAIREGNRLWRRL
jgi:hypothetical protein